MGIHVVGDKSREYVQQLIDIIGDIASYINYHSDRVIDSDQAITMIRSRLTQYKPKKEF